MGEALLSRFRAVLAAWLVTAAASSTTSAPGAQAPLTAEPAPPKAIDPAPPPAAIDRAPPPAAIDPAPAPAAIDPAPPPAAIDPAPPPAAIDPAPPPAAALQEPIVTAIEIRSEVAVRRMDDVLQAVELEVGKPLEDRLVRHTIQNLVATGLTSQVEVYTREEGAGVAAVLVLRPVTEVSAVRLEGELGLSREELRPAILQRAREPLAEESLVQGVYNLEDTLHDNGFLQAKVHVKVDLHPDTRQAVVVYQVACGARAKVGEVVFDGNIAPYKPEELIARLKLRPGDVYRKRPAEEDAERLQLWLIEHERGMAQVDRPREDYLAASNTVRLTYPISVGPRVELRLVGANLEKLRKKGLLPFLGAEGYDEALVQQALARIRAYYQHDGYYHVKVDSASQRSDGVLNLSITIVPGEVYRLDTVSFRGNEAVSGRKLADLMATSAHSLLRPDSGRLIDDVLAADLENVRSYYALQGYGQAEVGPARITESGTSLKLAVPIVEGPQERVVRLVLNGVEKLDAQKLRRGLSLKEGGPFHPVLLDDSLNTIRTSYLDQGYMRVQVSARTDWDPTHHLVDLTMDVFEGPQRQVDRVIVRGNLHTKTDVIRRAAGLKSGGPLGQATLYQVQSNLYRLGIFSRVDADLTGSGLLSPERDVLIRVEEGMEHALTYGAGYDSQEGLRGLLGFSATNVAGRAYSLRTYLRLSQRDTRVWTLFDQPSLGSIPLPLTSSLFYFDTTETSFRVKHSGARAEAVKLVGHNRFSLALDYRVVKLRVDPGVALNDIERENRPYQLSSLIPSALIDHRDDALVPTRGWSSFAQLQYSFPLFSQAEFVKLFLQQTQYLNLQGAGVVAASLRLGGIEAYHTLAQAPDVPLDLPSANVPINERFFAGGATSHRAYGLDLLGIPGETLIPVPGKSSLDPAGGNGLLLANLDYRFPIAGSFGGTLFFDSGNVWADWRDIRPGAMKSGVGFGLRYLLPIGPVRVEVGWKLQRERHPEEPPYVISFSLGNPF